MSKNPRTKLSKVVAQTISLNGKLTVKKAANLFGSDRRLQTNVLRICGNQLFVAVVHAGFIVDHRAIAPLSHVIDCAARLIVSTENRLGRVLSHKRANALVANFQRIRHERLALEGVKNFLKITQEQLHNGEKLAA